jgi:ATP-dependent DNA helicase RecQ
MIDMIDPIAAEAHPRHEAPEAPSLLSVLKRSFGFSAFRPLQEDIIRDSLAGRDVVALLPTGGGKSLCFQLPAVVRAGLTVVVSPLIALMKDQVDALEAAGVPATFLNSSLDADEARIRVRGLREGRYRLLYVAPERLMTAGFLAALGGFGLGAIAVDEAHCISEWGHDFRPEYRRLAELRDIFPGAPIMALSATATERVRADIATSLRLRAPRCYVASFDRPNLLYRVESKADAHDQIAALLRRRRGECGIVYAQSRKAVERIAERLRAEGESAAPYHAGLDAAVRSSTQEAFTRDEVRVICATVAFGMGIDKPNVRFVVHHDLPKDLESYYQETGRAGRDGLPSECVLLFNASDAVKQSRFIEEKPDPDERARARRKLSEMVSFAESGDCRRTALLAYFGEAREAAPCAGCDNCLSPRERYDGTLEAQKLLSCVLRIRQKSDMGVGLSHVAAVLTGAESEKIRRLGHETLSTYGIGKDRPRAEWLTVGRELLRLGLLRLTEEKFSVLAVTPTGREALARRATITLTRAQKAAAAAAPAALACDEALMDRLRTLRKALADARDVPAFVIFSDVALRQMAREYPVDVGAFRRINGVGDKKLADLGAAFMQAIGDHVAAHGKQRWEEPAAPPVAAKPLNETARETLRRLREGATPEAIAQARSLTTGTIWGHLAAAVEAGEDVDPGALLTPDQQSLLTQAFAELGAENLAGVVERLGNAGVGYGQARFWRASLGRRRAPPAPVD